MIDHVVPLGEAWRSGANTWTAAKRNQFYNEMTWPQLIASGASTNSSKGDRDPSTWPGAQLGPPRGKFRCNYARMWIRVKTKYALKLQGSEKSALSSMLDLRQ